LWRSISIDQKEIDRAERLFSKERKRPMAFFSKAQSGIRASSNMVSLCLKDVEEDLSSAQFAISFDPQRVNVEDVRAPELSNNLEITIEKKIDNIEGKVEIVATIVDKEEPDTSTTKRALSEDLDEIPEDVIPDDENIAPIAEILIKLVQKRGMSTLSSEDLLSSFSIEKVELRDAEGRLIETESLPEKTQLLQPYPNPAKDGCYIPFDYLKTLML
jgi:hypothetical protein